MVKNSPRPGLPDLGLFEKMGLKNRPGLAAAVMSPGTIGPIWGKYGEHPIIQRLFSHIPPGQLLRYLLVGVWNTLFGYSMFAAFTYMLSTRWPRNGYIVAGLLASVLNISVAFLGYKKFVFKTKGNYFEEWLRCMAVYGSGIAIGSVLLPCVVFIIRHTTALDRKAPYVGAALLTGFNIIYNFLGNKKFAFWKSA